MVAVGAGRVYALRLEMGRTADRKAIVNAIGYHNLVIGDPATSASASDTDVRSSRVIGRASRSFAGYRSALCRTVIGCTGTDWNPLRAPVNSEV